MPLPEGCGCGDRYTASGGIGGYADGAAVSDWARESMEWAVGAGIITGRDSGARTLPERATRAEVAVMLQRLVEHMAYQSHKEGSSRRGGTLHVRAS